MNLFYQLIFELTLFYFLSSLIHSPHLNTALMITLKYQRVGALLYMCICIFVYVHLGCCRVLNVCVPMLFSCGLNKVQKEHAYLLLCIRLLNCPTKIPRLLINALLAVFNVNFVNFRTMSSRTNVETSQDILASRKKFPTTTHDDTKRNCCCCC